MKWVLLWHDTDFFSFFFLFTRIAFYNLKKNIQRFDIIATFFDFEVYYFKKSIFFGIYKTKIEIRLMQFLWAEGIEIYVIYAVSGISPRDNYNWSVSFNLNEKNNFT